jgi:peptidoglycan/xylan/chitin deacetylase (PgdA/CDA1 family)
MKTRQLRQGTFLISFDCEGKFGFANRLSPALNRLLSNTSNTSAYREILAVLDRYQIRATFGFVGAFTLHPDEMIAWRNYFPQEQINGRPWLDAYFSDEQRGHFDGWLNPEPFRLVQAALVHELGSHGFSHLPLSEAVSSADAFDRELRAACALSKARGYVVRTLIYPGNQVGHIERLLGHGILGFRDTLSPTLRGNLRRTVNILREFNMVEKSQSNKSSKPVVAIPSGHFLNFHQGPPRNLVPRSLTRRRWRTILDHASNTGGVAHLWSHPHNFLTDPGLYEELGAILANVRRMMDEGRLVNPTLAEYSSSVLKSD